MKEMLMRAALVDDEWAGLSADGRLVTCDSQGACAIRGLDGVQTSMETDDAEKWLATSILPLSDGGYVVVRRSRKAASLGVYDYDFAHVGADGAVAQFVSACAYSVGAMPELFFYSEAAGDETARVLWMDGADATRAREVAISDVLGGKGASAVNAACVLMPLGLTRDGSAALVNELNNENLYRMDLETPALATVATGAEIGALFARRETGYSGMARIGSLGWNGGDYLTGWLCAPGCALRLGIK